MTWKIKKAEPDGRIHTFGVRLKDHEMVVVDDDILAKRFEAFGYLVKRTTHKPGYYDPDVFDQTPSQAKKAREKKDE